ncbi:Ankyrin-3 [Fusarium oxysporum f. sp. conglutinans]|nr:Ankyrin-3 [Fusarium oxysporum f. sp. conglutinans]
MKAICLAYTQQSQWTATLSRVFLFVFAGCFQRTPDDPTLLFKTIEYLKYQVESATMRLVTPATMQTLARCLRDVNEAFLATKITLQSNIISLGASEGGSGRINRVFDRATGSLGLHDEIIILEESGESGFSFPELSDKVYERINHHIPYKPWAPIEQTLIALSPLPQALKSTSLVESHPLFSCPEYKKWAESHYPCVLYIRGQDHHHRLEAAEQVLLKWQSERRKISPDYRKSLSIPFRFSALDPKRRSIKDLIGAFLLGHVANNGTSKREDEYELMMDQFSLQNAWSDEDLLQILNFLLSIRHDEGTLLLLEDMDECDKASLEAFWTNWSSFASGKEYNMKLVVTCKISEGPFSELSKRQDILVTEYNLPENNGSLHRIPQAEHLDSLVSTLCPGGHGEAIIRSNLQRLISMDRETLGRILKLIQRISNWPKEITADALNRFCHHIQMVSVSTNPPDILDLVLRDLPDQNGVRWLLSWLIHGHRPVTRDELAQLFCFYMRSKPYVFDAPSPADQRHASELIESWFRSLTETRGNQLYFLDDVKCLLVDDKRYIWNEIESSEALLQFLVTYLTAPNILERLNGIFDSYLALVRSSCSEMTPPLVANGREIIFYAVEGLPHQISNTLKALGTWNNASEVKHGGLAEWAQLYWAMSNPFSRPKINQLVSPFDPIMALNDIDPAIIEILKGYKLLIIPEQTAIGDIDTSPLTTMYKLANAIKAADEQSALVLANRMLSISRCQIKDEEVEHSPGSRPELAWPSSFLWRATWLNMSQLLDLLLDSSNPDPTDGASKLFPSPLYMASRICQGPVIDVLLKHGARMDVKRKDTYSSLYTAAGTGNIYAINSLVSENSSFLESEEPYRPLVIASMCGNWKAAERLLELGADPNGAKSIDTPDQMWAPLVIAVDENYVKTTEVLLKFGADPNIPGPGNNDTALWFAAVNAVNVECVRLLLAKGADPNHKLLKPPILIEIVKSTGTIEKRIAVLKALLEHSIPAVTDASDDDAMSPLLHAAIRGELQIVKLLLDHEADINTKDSQGYCVLAHAIKNNHTEVVRELLKLNPNLDVRSSDNESLLDLAINDITTMQMLLDAGVDKDIRGWNDLPAINLAVTREKVEVVKLLAERGANLECPDEIGWTPILDATGYVGSPDITRILAEHGANLKITTTGGSSPLHLCLWESTATRILRILLEFRNAIDIEARNAESRTALSEAAGSLDIEPLKLLIRAGADINSQDSEQWTPLMFALQHSRSPEAVGLLLSQSEIEVNVGAEATSSPLILACRNLDLDLVKTLLDKGADPNAICIGLYTTPLIAVCRSDLRVSDSPVRIDQIVRHLVACDADVNATQGKIVYNPLSAAALASGPSTINFLIEQGASLSSPDPLGRLPIHFAAVNGVDNFQTLSAAYTGDLLLSDCRGKNVLHWAAQFGHKETLKAILDRLDPSELQREHYVNEPDIDGWTPLCWATRPVVPKPIRESASEPHEHLETVKYLIQQGASCSVEFSQGIGENREIFTPAEMARLCGADDEMVKLLNDNADRGNETRMDFDGGHRGKPHRKYRTGSAYCGICLNTIFGQAYQCQSCHDFDVCQKCYGHIDIYHHQSSERHIFKLREGHEEEFEDLPSPSISMSSFRSGDTNRNSKRSRGDDGAPSDVSMEDLDDISSVESMIEMSDTEALSDDPPPRLLLHLWNDSDRSSGHHHMDGTPDYDIDIKDLLRNIACNIIETTDSLVYLSLVKDPSMRETPGLPSWVPDYPPVLYNSVHGPNFRSIRTVNSSKHVPHSPNQYPFTIAGHVLEAFGFRLGTVRMIGEGFLECLQGRLRILGDILLAMGDIYPYTNQHADEVLWRTLIWDTDFTNRPSKLIRLEDFQRAILHNFARALQLGFKEAESASAGQALVLQFTRDMTYLDEIAAKFPNSIFPSTKLIKALCGNLDIVPQDSDEFDQEELQRLMEPPSKHAMPPYNIMASTWINHRAILTDTGYLGMGPDSTQAGDEVWIISGCPAPLVMRKAEERNDYCLIGETYIHGAMQGEAVTDNVIWENIKIV